MMKKRKAMGSNLSGSSNGAVRTLSESIESEDLEIDESYGRSDTSTDEDEDHSGRDEARRARQRFKFGAIAQSLSESRPRSAMFGDKDFSWLKLKSDHLRRPLWIDPGVSNGSTKGPKLTIEAFSPLAAMGTDLLTMIAEPISRPAHIHEWRLTEHSLYAALSVGYTAEYIIRGLETFSKTPVPARVIEFIKNHTKHYGKVRLVLRENQFWLESDETDIIQMLLSDPTIAECREKGTEVEQGIIQMKGAVIQGTTKAQGLKQVDQTGVVASRDVQDTEYQKLLSAVQNEDENEDEEEEEESTIRHTLRFRIASSMRDTVAKRCLDIGYPAVYEYDYENDDVNLGLQIDLRPATQIRSYQEKALSKMFSNSRAKSGIIVLPCGAGKTLIGITAGCHIKKSIVVLTTSAMSSHQWANEFKKWSDIKEEDIAVLSSTEKKRFVGEAGILVTTYSMLVSTGKRAHDTQAMLDWIQAREWGLMILDEVHVAPAKQFRQVGHYIHAHCKLGLTATLLREDDKIDDLNFLIGPKLYEANWMELSEQGHIARVQCAEVWCPMSIEFYQEYQRETTRKQMLYYIMNPTKYQVCQYLIDYHEKRGDKIIVFSDNIAALKHYAVSMKKYYICGDTSEAERLDVLHKFQHDPSCSTVFLSKIGDTSLDLPEATCLIQISSHYGSRRQEAQRLGRILRAKRRNDEGFNAFFYSLVSKDTMEMAYSAKRQAFLVDQGYAFRTITHLAGMEQMPGLAYTAAEEREEYLASVMLMQESSADVEAIDGDAWSHLSARGKQEKKEANVQRQAIAMADASGGGTMAPMYRERERGRRGRRAEPESEYFKKEKRKRDLAAKKRKANLITNE